jgi:lysyl-tRNA synthetase class 2
MPSSVIATTHYNKDSQVLKVIFRSGAVYLYYEVPEEIYLLYMKARSKGTFLNQFIKGNFEFEKVA